jgi:DTW domain-containing protein YfiP
LQTSIHFWILIHPEECRKPTNTARLISASLPQARQFLWHRTVPPTDFLTLLATPQFQPVLLYPSGNVALFEGLTQRPWLPDRLPAFVLLDGTWSQARKMLLHSPYLHRVPQMAMRPEAPSAYALRRQIGTQHLSTVEVAIALLAQCGETRASQVLHAYFRVFMARALAARHGHPCHQPLPELDQLLASR